MKKERIIKKTQTNTYIGTMGDYLFPKKGWVYWYLASSFKETSFDFWCVVFKNHKISLALNQGSNDSKKLTQKTYLEPLIFYTNFFMKTINYWFFSQSLELKVQWFWNQNQTKNGGH